MRRLFIMSMMLALGCSGKKTIVENTDKELNETSEYKMVSHDDLLEGVWALNETTEAFFSIRGDSVYYVEELDNPVPFRIIGDTLVINYGNFLTKDLIMRLDKDSIVIKDEVHNVIKLYRR